KVQEFLGLDVTNLENLDELYDILQAYPGDIQVFVKKDGKKFKLNAKVRNCKGLITELLSILEEQDIIFFNK
ncbi:MAG: hypothetical protein J6R29_03700, partial [Clostridia bacterium]|nr:hypothetical protein [Clostridia bacterium]